MNPFELRGPEFLLFYAAVSLTLLVWLGFARRSGEPDPDVPVHLTDPYAIAFLREGGHALLSTVTMGLIDRRLLSIDNVKLRVVNKANAQLIQNPLERAVLQCFERERPASDLYRDHTLNANCTTYEHQLSRLGLLPDSALKRERWKKLALALAVLLPLSFTKMAIGLARGRSVGFLVIETILVVGAAWSIANVRRTKRGDAVLQNLQSLLDGLRGRAHSFRAHADTNELLLFCAMFGANALPVQAFPYTKTLFPKTASSDSSSSSCGSSCGGGCGGGCGGCGS